MTSILCSIHKNLEWNIYLTKCVSFLERSAVINFGTYLTQIDVPWKYQILPKKTFGIPFFLTTLPQLFLYSLLPTFKCCKIKLLFRYNFFAPLFVRDSNFGPSHTQGF